MILPKPNTAHQGGSREGWTGFYHDFYLPGQAWMAARALGGLWPSLLRIAEYRAPSLLSVSLSDGLHAPSGPAVEFAPNRCLFRAACRKAPGATSRTAGGIPRSKANC